MTLNHLLRTGVTALGALAIASVTQASASDLYAGGGSLKDAPIGLPSWSGFYIGGHLGAAWAHLDLNRQEFNDHVVINNVDPAVAFGGGSLDTTGAFGGAQLGYNWQNGNCCFVFGIELDIGGLAGDDERTFLAVTPSNTAAVRFRREGGFYGDITGRVGYTWSNNVLLYAKGGFAWLNADFKVDEAIIGSGGITTFDGRRDNNDTITGWTVGGGFEWMLNPNWTMKVEYLHFDFSNDNNNNNCCGDGFGTIIRNNADLTVDTVKLGFNYLFHSTPDVIPYK